MNSCKIVALYSFTYIFYSSPLGSLALSSKNIFYQEKNRAQQYETARETRISRGHEQSLSQFVELLDRYPDDCTTASHLAATWSTPHHQHSVARNKNLSKSTYGAFRRLLLQANFTNQQVSYLLGVRGAKLQGKTNRLSSFSKSPIYLIPAAAGTLDTTKVDNQLTRTPVECLVALFLLGATVSHSTIRRVLGQEFLDIATSLSLLYPSDMDPTRALASVQIFPVELPDTFTSISNQSMTESLFFITDWHPRVLSQTKVGKDAEGEEPVMYIGPDSLGLVQHFWCNNPLEVKVEKILDLCTGSGIQALYGLALHGGAQATCVDVSPRALRFVLINALLNDIDPCRLQFVEGDLLSGKGRHWQLDAKLDWVDLIPTRDEASQNWFNYPDRFDVITANPPFLPVPPDLAHRHGKFSDGGSTGECVLKGIVGMAGCLLEPNGMLALVSEFFLAPSDNVTETNQVPWTADTLLSRIKRWWNSGWNHLSAETEPSGFLVTNEYPIDRKTYALRRADSKEEFFWWVEHLESIGMAVASPGFLYLCKGCDASNLEHRIAPRSPYGSLWTPSNPDAVAFSASLLRSLVMKQSDLS